MEGGGGGPAPFLLKTYDMVDDSATDDIVSWSPSKISFVVWNPPEFCRILLPTYFKHNNFSSFIRQLNTYGFRKIDPERWEFANEDFVKDKKHLLKNIHRRKPVHSHSLPPPGSSADPERAVLEETIERLTKEKADLQANLHDFEKQQTGAEPLLEELEQRVQSMEIKQQNLIQFLGKAVNSPKFLENLIQMAGSSSIEFDISVYNKKRRQLSKGEANGNPELLDHSSNDDQGGNYKPIEFGSLFSLDLSNNLNLELSPAVSDCNLVSGNTQSSSEEARSVQRGQSEGNPPLLEPRPLVMEEVELMDTSASLCHRKGGMLPWQGNNSTDDDEHISCRLNLTLASSPYPFDEALYSDRGPSLPSQKAENSSGLRSKDISNEDNSHELTKTDEDKSSASLSPAISNQGNNIQEAAPATGRVNDVFWEQFLTEKPGCSENEEASSSLRPNVTDERQEMGTPEKSLSWRNGKDLGMMKL